MKDIKPWEIIHRKEFVREPIQKILKEIDSLNASKIILNGSGTGRSTFLNYMEERKAGTEQPFINMKFDTIGVGFSSKNEEVFPNEFVEHYWEERFANQLFHYIKSFYEFTYSAHFEKSHEILKKSIKETDSYINQASFVPIPLPKLFTSKEVTLEILENFKKSMGISSVNLGIDRFDQINNSDSFTQKILYSYFSLFDKTIITCDDITLPQEWYKTYFKEDSELFTFLPFSIEYGKDIETVYYIILKRIYEYNLEVQLNVNQRIYQNITLFPMDWINYESISFLINITNGNIKEILDIVNRCIEEWNWSKSLSQEKLDQIARNEVFNIRERELCFKNSKIHL